MRKTFVAAALLFVAAAQSFALEPGKAKGWMQRNDMKLELKYAAARLQDRGIGDGSTEVELIVSDQPITVEDLEDDTIPRGPGYLTVLFVKNAPWTYALHEGYSYSGGPEALKFTGTANEKSVVGRAYMERMVTFSGTRMNFDVEINAPVVTLLPPKFTAAEKNLAKKGPQLAAYMAYRNAEEADAFRATLAAPLVKQFEESYNMIGLLRSGHQTEDVKPVAVRVNGDRATMYADVSGSELIVRFVKEGEAWKVAKETLK